MNTNSLYTIMPTYSDHRFPFPDLSKITPSDKKLLLQAVLQFRPGSKNYEDSWGYVIQATRYGGFKWYDAKTGFLIFFGKKSGSDSTLVVPTFFAEPEYLAFIISKVEVALKAEHTIVKNVNAGETGSFTRYGFRRYKKNESWCAEARFDDQTFPQVVIDLKKTIEAKGTRYQNLRTTLNKKPNMVIRKFHETDHDAVLELFALKDGNSKDSSEKLKGMYYASHAMYPKAALKKFVIIDKETNELIGFTTTSDISSANTALVAAIFRPGVKIASTWGIYNTLQIKLQEGFVRINLGGNETKGPYNFMREKFRPVKELKKTHLVYAPKIKVKHI
jgi:hypothetical protein